MVATTTSTGTVSPIFFIFPFSYLTMPNPTNINKAAAAAILSIQPGNGYKKLVLIIAGRTIQTGTSPCLFLISLSHKFFV